MPTEDERAAQFREDYLARSQARCERAAALAGSPAARNALALAWRPVYLKQIERQIRPLEPASLEDEFCILTPEPHLLP